MGSGVRLYLAALNQCAQDPHDLGVEVVFGFEDGEDLLGGHGRAVGTVAGEGVEDIGGGQDAGGGVEIFGEEASVVAGAVEPFVVGGGQVGEVAGG